MKRYLKWAIYAFIALTLVITHLYTSIESFTAGQIVACNNVLKLHPEVKRLMYYCEYENGDVYVKSRYVKDRYSVTKGTVN